MIRFWKKVRKTPTCWLWTAAKSASGYGAFRVDGKTVRAHRYAYEIMIGPIPDGMFLLHECDTPACVNPEHLKVGDQAQNMADTARDRVQVRQRFAAGELQRVLAEEFGVSRAYIADVTSGRVV